jgi:FKBP-type peptidyl-prolyl cis-trans isomerase
MKTSIVVAVVAGCALLVACGNESQSSRARLASATEPAVTELQKTDLVVGAGPAISEGQGAVVHYTGWLYEPSAQDDKGSQFDSSRERGQPFRFRIGQGKVIQGWDQGVVGMQVGGQRRLIIPASLGYGARGGGPIPPNSTLLFEIELLAIE